MEEPVEVAIAKQEPWFFKFMTALLALLVSIILTGGGYFVSQFDKRISKHDDAIDAVQKDLGEMKSQLSQMNSTVSEIKGNLAAIGEFRLKSGPIIMRGGK